MIATVWVIHIKGKLVYAIGGPYLINSYLTHWGRVAHICVRSLTVIASDNGLSPGRRQAIVWTNAWKLLIGPLGTNLSEILIEIHTFSSKKMHLKMSSGKWRPFCLGLNVLRQVGIVTAQVEHQTMARIAEERLCLQRFPSPQHERFRSTIHLVNSLIG